MNIRRNLLFCLFALLSFAAYGQSIALTFDDGPKAEDTPRMTVEERNGALLDQLAKNHVKSALFLTLRDYTEERRGLVAAWGQAGHMVGNHSAHHVSFNNSMNTLEVMKQEVLQCDAVIRTMPGYTKYFRFPYLKEGDTEAKRDGFRSFLKSIEYHPAGVSVDASDWAYNLRLLRRLKESPSADLEPFRQAYLEHIWDRAQYYDRLSHRVLGRSVKHVLLLHHNLINALFLGSMIQMFKERGWRVLDAQDAFRDPVYAMEPRVLPAGESILWALGKAKGIKGLRYPGEDGDYEDLAFKKWGI